jgi:hypothetical protein
MRSRGHRGPWPREGRHTFWRRTWFAWCLVLAAVGLACAFRHWDPSILIPLMLTVAVCATAVAFVVGQDEGLPGVIRLVRTAFVADMAVTAAAGLGAVLGALGIMLVLAAVGTAPLLTSWVCRRWRLSWSLPEGDQHDSWGGHLREPDLDDEEAEQIRAPQELRHLDDASLCLAWRRSFVLLHQRTSVIKQMSLVQQRQEYLDELERRSPYGLAAWLDSGARASGNPLPYLKVSSRRRD